MAVKGWIAGILALALATGCQKPLPRDAARSAVHPHTASTDPTVIAFYNVENLFDTFDDPYTNDDDYLPDSDIRWNTRAYQIKLFNIARIIADIGGEGADIMGLAEVETRAVIADLLGQPPLAGRKYGMVHEDSPDERGIDTGLIFDEEKWSYISHEALRISLPGNARASTRLVLYVVLEGQAGLLHVVVNHWPSRREGQQESEPRRLAAAGQVAALLTRIRTIYPEAAMVVMGDFNDDPSNRSIREGLRALPDAGGLGPDEFFNPFARLHDPYARGSLTHQGKWNLFDQIMLSRPLINGRQWRYEPGSEAIFSPEYAQVGGTGRSRYAPKRSVFRGRFQADGFSDHFAVYLRIIPQTE